MALYKNTASQKIAVYAYTASTGAAKTGDAAQITGYISSDWGAAAAITDTNPTELDATHMQGWYVFDLTQAETNANVIVVSAVSSTAGVLVDQYQVFTQASVDQTGDSYARVGAPAGASVSADIAAVKTQTGAIETDTQDLQTQIGTNGAGLTAIGDARLANLDATVSSRHAAGAAVAKSPATLAAADVSGNLPVDVQTIKTQAVTAAAPVTVPASIGTSTHSAADVKTAIEADGSKLDHVWEMTEDDGGVRRLTANALEQAPVDGAGLTPQDVRDAMKLAPSAGAAAAGSVDAHLDTLIAAGGGAGAGTGTYTDTVTDGTNPLDGVRVQLSTDSAKTNPVYQAYTNALGVFLMHPDPGAYYVWFEKAGYDFSAVNGTGVTVT